MKRSIGFIFFMLSVGILSGQQIPGTLKLNEIHLRDVCVLPDKVSGTYYMIGSGRGASVVQYTSKDLINWKGPQTIFKTPANFWKDIPIRAIWAPELHFYKGKYYLFLTFSTDKLLPEQWLNWRPRVVRGSQTLVSDSPSGPFKAFIDHSIPPPDLMTLDGTLWEEDGKAYMVYAHEWVQVSNGTMEYLPLKKDLSEAAGSPAFLFRASEAPWAIIASKPEGCYVTDGPYLYKSKSGKLMMTWSSFGKGGYTVGVAVSPSGKLSGPWEQQAIPLYENDGGHGMIFKTFDNKLMFVLHSPNANTERPHFFELEDTGNTLQIIKEFKE